MPFRDAWGEPAQRFDLGQPNLPAEFVAPYAEAFRGHHASSSPSTRHQCWKALKFFARFLADSGRVQAPADLTTELFGQYILWLDALPSTANPVLSFRAYWRQANGNPSLRPFLDLRRERYDRGAS